MLGVQVCAITYVIGNNLFSVLKNSGMGVIEEEECISAVLGTGGRGCGKLWGPDNAPCLAFILEEQHIRGETEGCALLSGSSSLPWGNQAQDRPQNEVAFACCLQLLTQDQVQALLPGPGTSSGEQWRSQA